MCSSGTKQGLRCRDTSARIGHPNPRREGDTQRLPFPVHGSEPIPRLPAGAAAAFPERRGRSRTVGAASRGAVPWGFPRSAHAWPREERIRLCQRQSVPASVRAAAAQCRAGPFEVAAFCSGLCFPSGSWGLRRPRGQEAGSPGLQDEGAGAEPRLCLGASNCKAGVALWVALWVSGGWEGTLSVCGQVLTPCR